MQYTSTPLPPQSIIGLKSKQLFSDSDCPIWEDGYHFVLDKCYYQDHTLPWAKYSYIKAQETCAEKFKNGGRLFEPKDEQTNNMVFKTITSYPYSWPGEFFLGIVADTYTGYPEIVRDGEFVKKKKRKKATRV